MWKPRGCSTDTDLAVKRLFPYRERTGKPISFITEDGMAAADETNQRNQLSGNQVENLVKAMECVDAASEKPTEPCHVATEPLATELELGINRIHNSLADKLAHSFSLALRSVVEVRVVSVYQSNALACARSHEANSWGSSIKPDPLPGNWALTVAPGLCCVCVDRLLGGDPLPGETFSRPMTPIERSLMTRLIDTTLKDLHDAWEPVIDLCWTTEHLEEDQFPLEANADEKIIVVEFEIELCGNVGKLLLCMPNGSLGPVMNDLQSGKSEPEIATSAELPLARNIACAPVDVNVTLARSTIRTTDLLGLRVGDVIATEQRADEPLEMSVHNVPKFQVNVGSFQGRKAVQITKSIDG